MPSILPCTLTIILLLGSLTSAVAETPSADALIERHRQEKSPIWADGNTLTLFYRGQAEKVDVLFGGDTKALSRIGGSDVWTLAVKLPKLDHAIFSYRFLPWGTDPGKATSSAEPAVWRGPKAPAPAAECAELKGTLQQCEIESKSLAGPRKITLYLPPGHDSKKASRVIYAADGEAIDRFARVLEPLIAEGRVPPAVLIGVHSGGYIGGAPEIKNYDPQKDLRLQEYFPGINPKRYSDHESFFCSEVTDWAERRWGVSKEKINRVVFGYSNGGRFAVEMGIHHSAIFGHVFGFSVAGNGEFDIGPAPKSLPSFYLTAGTWETSFHGCTSRLAEKLKERKVPVKFSSRVGGHDTALWRDQFAAAVAETLGKK